MNIEYRYQLSVWLSYVLLVIHQLLILMHYCPSTTTTTRTRALTRDGQLRAQYLSGTDGHSAGPLAVVTRSNASLREASSERTSVACVPYRCCSRSPSSMRSRIAAREASSSCCGSSNCILEAPERALPRRAPFLLRRISICAKYARASSLKSSSKPCVGSASSRVAAAGSLAAAGCIGAGANGEEAAALLHEGG